MKTFTSVGENSELILGYNVQALLSASTALQVFIFHGCPGVTERSRHSLETFLASTGQNVRQVTWTVY